MDSIIFKRATFKSIPRRGSLKSHFIFEEKLNFKKDSIRLKSECATLIKKTKKLQDNIEKTLNFRVKTQDKRSKM